jgi:hypothetical protein
VTPTEAVDLVRKRISLKNPALLGLKVDVEVDARDTLMIRASYLVPHRDTGDQTRIFNVSTYHRWDDMPAEYLLAMVEDHIRSVFLHEFYETFHRDGVRIHDPHRDGR